MKSLHAGKADERLFRHRAIEDGRNFDWQSVVLDGLSKVLKCGGSYATESGVADEGRKEISNHCQSREGGLGACEGGLSVSSRPSKRRGRTLTSVEGDKVEGKGELLQRCFGIRLLKSDPS